MRSETHGHSHTEGFGVSIPIALNNFLYLFSVVCVPCFVVLCSTEEGKTDTPEKTICFCNWYLVFHGKRGRIDKNPLRTQIQTDGDTNFYSSLTPDSTYIKSTL